MIPIKIFRQGDKNSVPLPEYKTEGSSGFDLSCLENIIIQSEHRLYVPTGLFFEIPEGFEIQIRSRSGLARDLGLTVLNQPSTVDSDYRGEIGVLLYNSSKRDIRLEKGTRIAQAVLCAVERAEFTEVLTLDELKVSKRGTGGFGSTGSR